MTTTKVLVLDGQGVVFNSPFKKFLSSFAKINRLEYEQVERRWESRIRELAWRGLISDEQLWNELAGRKINVRETMLALSAGYEPGPAAKRLATWSQTVPIWLLSNHRSAWLLPKLEAFGLSSAFDKLLVSDRTGFIKPELGAFRQLLHGVSSAQDILFIDDQLHNVEAAQAMGCRAIFAAPGRSWLKRVDAALHTNPEIRTAEERR